MTTIVRSLSSVTKGTRKKLNNPGNPWLNYSELKRSENSRLLETAHQYWQMQQDERDRFERAWRYRRGEQWKDLVYNPDSGEYVREEDLIRAQGQIPFVVNMIAPLIKNLKGQFREARSRSQVIARTKEEAPVGDMLTNTLWAINDFNQRREKDSQNLEVFLVGGRCHARVDYKYVASKKRMEVRVKNCEASSMIYNPVRDIDHDDLTLIGQIHDLPIDHIVAAFAKNKKDEAIIRRYYSGVSDDPISSNRTGTDDHVTNNDFFVPSEQNLCRVYEIWQKRGEWRIFYHDYAKGEYDLLPNTQANVQKLEAENQQRIELAIQMGIEEPALIEYRLQYHNYWYVKFITPNYDSLFESESMYAHGEHPYVNLWYPLIRGEVWGFVEDVIDIQRGFNRDKILLDFVIGAGAKGTLLINEDALSPDMPFEEAVETYSKKNGVIKFQLKQGMRINEQVQQLVSKAVPAGLHESMALGMELMHKMGGVSDAIQGRNPAGGTPASLYAQMSQNSTLNSRDYMDAFNSFRTRLDRKVLDVAIQYYPEKRYLTVSGKSFKDEALVFDRSKLKEDLEYDLSVGMGNDSQIYRAMIDDQLFQFVLQGILPIEMMLKHSSIPFSNQLLDDINQMKEQAKQGQEMIGKPGMEPQLPNTQRLLPGIVQGIQQQGGDVQQASPEALALMKQYAGIS